MFYVFVVVTIIALFIGVIVVDLRSRSAHRQEYRYIAIKRGEAENYTAGDNRYVNSGS